MANLTADTDDVLDEITSIDDVEAVLEEAFELKREAIQRERKVEESTAGLRDERDAIEAEIEEIESQHEPYIERRREAVQARKEAIVAWARAHKDYLLDGLDGKTFETTFGAVSFTRVPFSFDWIDKEDVVESLKAIGRDDLIRVEEKPETKTVLKKEPEVVRRIDGVDPQEAHDRVSVDLKIG